MMADYLLTFCKDGCDTYKWFESGEEMLEFIEDNKGFIIINEAIHIIQSKMYPIKY